jgi:hypothetical protein
MGQWRVVIKPATKAGRKKTAVFRGPEGQRRTIHFGEAGASDFTKHRDVARKGRYLARHRAREDWTNPRTAGALSRWILWNKPTLRDSIADFKRRFRLR